MTELRLDMVLTRASPSSSVVFIECKDDEKSLYAPQIRQANGFEEVFYFG